MKALIEKLAKENELNQVQMAAQSQQLLEKDNQIAQYQKQLRDKSE